MFSATFLKKLSYFCIATVKNTALLIKKYSVHLIVIS